MKRWLPLPLTSVLLFLAWLLINQSFSPGQVLLAAVAAVSLPILLKRLQPLDDPVIYKPEAMFSLLLMALVEIIRSCFNVSRIIMFRHSDGIQSQFIRIPLDMSNSYGLAMLSCLINITPGTVWVEIMPDTNELSVHVFDLHDQQWWVSMIKTRYEKPLMKIFENHVPGDEEAV